MMIGPADPPPAPEGSAPDPSPDPERRDAGGGGEAAPEHGGIAHEPGERRGPGAGAGAAAREAGRDRGFRDRKREDHALVLIEELEASLGDLPRARRLLLELGRFYDPVLGGAIMAVEHQRAIMSALEAGRIDQARELIARRYQLYVKDRAHLGPRRPGAGAAEEASS
jgi:hypothetical protein